MSEAIELGLYDRFPFGKHKGLTVEHVIQNSPDYIRWAIDNNVILLSNEAYSVYERAAE